jgi:cytochrome c biogenesis protein CcmG, thiol:disulfide interchange protein DsbE
MSLPLDGAGGRFAPRRRRHAALFGSIILACVMAMFVALLATRSSAQDKQARSPLLGHLAPPVVGTSVQGAPVKLSDYSGRYVLVNFFATWCVPCQQEHPQLQAWTSRHASKGDATVFGVVFDDTAANAHRFMQQNGGAWPVIDDPGGVIALNYGVRGPPESFLVGPDGVVQVKFIGEVTADGLDRAIARLQARGI